MKSHTQLSIMLAAAIGLLVCLPAPAGAQPQPPGFGFGLILGEPTGLSLRFPTGGNTSWDAALGTSWFGRITVHADHLWAVNAFRSRTAGLYFGLGGVVGIGRGRGVLYRGEGRWYYYEDENAVGLGVRGSFGINAMLSSAPVEFFGEVAPVVGVVPAFGVGWDASIGVRFYP